MIASSSLESLEFLFQKRSQASNQISPHAPFAVASAVNGQEAFQSQTAPNQTLKKRKILLNYNSCLRLWNPTEMALEIAKLKQEGFEVAFILKGKNEGDIFESLIEDKAEGDKKYDYKFKDKDGEDKSIFELSDQFIKENFSKLDHETSINKLNLTRDESIILSNEQFDQVDKIFKQEYWADKERVSTNSSLSYSFFKGAVNEYPSYESVVDSNNTVDSFTSDDDNTDDSITSDDSITIAKKLQNLLTHEDFDIKDEKTSKALNKLSKLTSEYDNQIILGTDFENLMILIKNEKTLEALFDKIPSLIFDEDLKILMQKNILKKLWFNCSDFEDVVRRAKTLDEFRNELPNKIASSLFPNQENSFAIYLKFNPVFPFDILERYKGGNALSIFKTTTEYIPPFKTSSIINIIAQQKTKQTSVGKKIKVDFALSDNRNDDNFIKFDLELSEVKLYGDLSLSEFIEIFSNPEINQHFNLTEQFGDAIISSLKSQPLSTIF